VADDEQSVELQALLASDRADADVASEITGLDAGHPLHAAFTDRVHAARS